VSTGAKEGGTPAPIIIKKIRKAGHAGHHGGAWKVAYADMVTALMALFIVLWILSQSEEIVSQVAGYFRDPIGFTEGGRVVPSAPGHSTGDPNEPDGGKPPATTTPIEVEDPDLRWQRQAESIRAALFQNTGLERFEDQVQIAMTPEGLSITLLETADGPLFEVGGVKLNRDAESLLQAIAGEIAKTGNFITIEGHTDSLRFSRGDNTNWELSTGRALTARRILERAGLPERQTFEIRGLADRLLYDPLDPENSMNRRVSITLLSEAAHRDRVRQFNDSALFDELR